MAKKTKVEKQTEPVLPKLRRQNAIRNEPPSKVTATPPLSAEQPPTKAKKRPELPKLKMPEVKIMAEPPVETEHDDDDEEGQKPLVFKQVFTVRICDKCGCSKQ